MSGPISTGQFHVARGGAQGIDSGPLSGAVVAIGNFDGVHRGHRAVIGAALTRARELGRKAAALTFTPHPRRFLRPQDTLFELSDERNKLRLLAATGLMAPSSCVLTRRWRRPPPKISSSRFSRVRSVSVARRSASIFISARTAWARRVFWPNRSARLAFAVDIVPPLEDEGRPVSSGAVRAALAAGRVVEATELLGGPWFVSGEVIHGDKRGREFGFPTANLKLSPSCGLKHGIYAVRVDIAGKRHDGVASFGRRPHVRRRGALA